MLVGTASMTVAHASGDGVRPTGGEKPAEICQATTCDSAPAELDGDQVVMLQKKLRSSSDDVESKAGWSVPPEETCPLGTVLAFGDDCPEEPTEVTTTPAPFCDENGMTASGKKCEGKIKTKIQTSRITRPCQTASGDDCEGDFQIKYRTTYEDKDGEWVKFKREMSRDGGKTWKPLPLLLSQLDTFTQDAEEALPPSCCVAAPTTTATTTTTTEQSIKPQSVLGGTVKDAKTNYGVEGATVKIQAQGLTATTDKDGGFYFGNVDVGEVVVTAEAQGYANYESNALTIAEGANSHIDIMMSAPVQEGEWRIVMTWEKLPQDLELTTRFGKCYIAPAPRSGGDLGIWDEAETSCTDETSGTTAAIDIDNYDKQSTRKSPPRMRADAPETTTLTNVNGNTGRIIVRVDNWKRITSSPGVFSCNPAKSQYKPTECGPIADSKAKVELHGPGTEKTFTVEKDGVASDDGKFWYVCSIDVKTGIVSPCKSVAECE